MKRLRSLLCVPAHKPLLFQKSLAYGADCIMLDLEDSVPPQHKAAALANVLEFLRGMYVKPYFSGLMAVRINPRTNDASELTRKGDCRLDAIVVPKVVDGTSCVTDAFYRVPTIPVIETPQALVNLRSIVQLPSVAACIFGVADFAAGMGVSDRVFADELAGASWVNCRFSYAKQKLATYCAAYGMPSLDTCFIVKGELAGLHVRRQWADARGYGFTGAACIHPMQVGIANDVFGPTESERRWAMVTSEGHVKRDGEVGVDENGCVVGIPVARQAAAILKTEVTK